MSEHQPYPSDEGHAYCRVCGEAWPCPTWYADELAEKQAEIMRLSEAYHDANELSERDLARAERAEAENERLTALNRSLGDTLNRDKTELGEEKRRRIKAQAENERLRARFNDLQWAW